MSDPVIRFPATVYKVQTLIDGGVRVTLDLPETAIPQMAMLAQCKADGIPLMFTAEADSGLVGKEMDKKRGRA